MWTRNTAHFLRNANEDDDDEDDDGDDDDDGDGGVNDGITAQTFKSEKRIECV